MGEHNFKVVLKFTNIAIGGDNESHATENLKQQYKDMYNIELRDSEIEYLGGAE